MTTIFFAQFINVVREDEDDDEPSQLYIRYTGVETDSMTEAIKFVKTDVLPEIAKYAAVTCAIHAANSVSPTLGIVTNIAYNAYCFSSAFGVKFNSSIFSKQ